METELRKEMDALRLLVYPEYPPDTDSYPVRILRSGCIHALLPCRILQMNGESVFCYDAGGYSTFAEAFDRKLLNGKILRAVFQALEALLEEAEEYLLSADSVLLSPEYIFMEEEGKDFFFCLFPPEQKKIREQLSAFAEYLLPRLDHGDPEAVRLGYGFSSMLDRPSFGKELLKELLYGNESAADQTCRRHDAETKERREAAPPPFEEAEEEKRKAWEDLFVPESRKGKTAGRSSFLEKVFMFLPFLVSFEISCILFCLWAVGMRYGLITGVDDTALAGIILIFFSIAGIVFFKKPAGRPPGMYGERETTAEHIFLQRGGRKESAAGLGKTVQNFRG